MRTARSLPWVFIALVALGVFFRVFHADWKLYNPDEANTSIRLTGHTSTRVGKLLHDGRLHHLAELREFAVPSATVSAGAVTASLADEDPQHPPLFFIVSLASQRVTGDSIFFRRLPAIVFGILALAAAWCFGRELFGAPEPAWLLTALIAVSPFHVAYAQEAREYSLFLLTTCLSSALLLHALRVPRLSACAAYAVSVALGLWSFTLFGLILAAHALLIAMPVSGASAQARWSTALAAAVGAVSFAPWFVNLFHRAGTAASDTDWQSTPLSAPLYFGKWLFNAGSMFFDLDYLSLWWLPLVVAVLAIAACASLLWLRRGRVRACALPVAIGGITLAALLAPDLLLHQTRALQSRYLTALWLAVEIATAGGLWIALTSTKGPALAAWRIAATTLFVSGIASCGVAAYARTWWITGSPELRAFPAIVERLQTLPSATIVYLKDDDDMLLFEPYGNPQLAFELHPHLDAGALAGAARPYAILSSEAADRLPIADRLERVPLAATFEMYPDPAIDALRRRASSARRWTRTVQLDLALYRAAGPHR